ncbi:lipase family protein [Leptothoe sp. PORK10 BA2]|uniref:lipase family protein n=1 Tax=Leptothoe sp. PORK10 BA2 TaxID=3110254 RepID=UPI002B20AE34|nr:lipase family protein [Leptothoe sp. PORK10 BA2]MEA5463816.1 lipase family protein [Leptothoe sp. PORK10 BA2]
MGAVPVNQESRSQANIAINQFEEVILPRIEDEVMTLTGSGNPNDDLETRHRKRFLLIQSAFAAAVGLSSLALAYGVRSYRKYHQWQRIDFLRRATQEFENDPGVAQALSILDFEEYRDYTINTPGTTEKTAVTFQVTNDLLSRALSSSKARKNRRQTLEWPSDGQSHTSDMQTYYAETSVRDWFNQMLTGLEHFGHMVDSGVFTVKEVKPWLNYWVRLIADETYRRNCDSRVYDQLYNYIHDHGFDGVKQLFDQFGYRILRSPYQGTDFQKLGDVNQYSTELALSLAKVSQLVYQDVRYVTEIANLWKIDIRNNFRFFNANKRDTQALIFRTDEFMVLAFRGTQEIRDWTTNLDIKMRNFTIRRAGKTTISTYKGKVHTGFFLGWADIERDVLAQLEYWQNECQKPGGSPLPPLLITGHSLGGALATMAAASLHENGINVAGLYTFGQPRVGDLTFSRQLEKNLAGKVFRFVNNNDIVTHVPPPFSFRNSLRFYGHLGTIKYINSKGQLTANYKAISRAVDGFIGLIKSLFETGFDLITDHSMSCYISHLTQTLEGESKDRKATSLEEDINRLGGGPCKPGIKKK